LGGGSGKAGRSIRRAHLLAKKSMTVVTMTMKSPKKPDENENSREKNVKEPANGARVDPASQRAVVTAQSEDGGTSGGGNRGLTTEDVYRASTWTLKRPAP